MGENPNKDVILFDPTLFSIAGWFGQYDKAEIKRFCCTVFSKANLKTAMQVICDTDKLQGVREANHIKPELCFDSIWNNIEYLDQSGKMPVFAAKSTDIQALPMAAPVEQLDGIPHGRLGVVEKAVATLIMSNKEILDKIDQINKTQPLYSQVVHAHPESKTPASLTQSISHAVKPSHTQSIPPELHLPPPMQSRAPPNNVSQQKEVTKNAQSCSADALDTNEWNVAQRRRPKVIRGTAPVSKSNVASVRIGWTPAPRDIFVYHTNHLTTKEDISDLMAAQSKVIPMNVEKRSKDYAYFGSFRVTVRRDDFDEAMKAEHWPAGWSIREYYVSRERREVERLQRANAVSAGTDSMNEQLHGSTDGPQGTLIVQSASTVGKTPEISSEPVQVTT